MALYIADGQLGASSATLVGAGGNERTIAITLFNSSAVEQTVVLTITRSGSTARTIVRATMEQYETLYVRGVPLDPSDILAGYSTGASVVDYLISHAASSEPFSILNRDESGAPKASTEITVETTEKFGLTRDGITIAGLLEDLKKIAMKIAS